VNEEQLAELFLEQVDRLLGGEAVADVPGLDDWSELATLGQQLSQVDFQPRPVVQAAFNSQLASWFGPPAGGSAPLFLGMSKNSLLGVVAAITALGGGLGLVFLTGTILPGLFSFDPADKFSVPATAEVPAPVTPEAPVQPTLDPVEANDLLPNPTKPSFPSTAGDTLPDIDSSQKDTLPPATPQRSDTLTTPTATPTVSPTLTTTTTSVGPTAAPPQYIDDKPDSTDAGDGPSQVNDEDRGHGNDPDRYDEDNPGQSTGAGPDDNRGGGSSGGGGKGGGKKN
jgi:hypothetical protein